MPSPNSTTNGVVVAARGLEREQIAPTTTSMSEGSGFASIVPWWALLLVGLILVIIGAVRLASLCFRKSSSGNALKKKGSKRHKVVPHQSARNLAEKHKGDMAREKMGSRHSKGAEAGVEKMTCQPLLSRPIDPHVL